MAQNTANQQLFDLLITKNFDIQALDGRTGRAPVDEDGNPDISKADEFRFDFVPESGKNYGSVVILLGDDKELMVFFGDNVGKSMEAEDKTEWFSLLEQLKHFATKNFMSFTPQNIGKLKYTKQTQATVNESLQESWQGKGNISWNGQATEARLIIKHKKSLHEDEARFRFIESIYVETAEGERFKMKSRSLTAAKAMLEHVRQGGNPYDNRGQHINEIVEELSVLSRFRRASSGKMFEGDTKNLVEQTNSYYKNMHSILKHLGSSRGYQGYFESWTPGSVSEGNLVVEDLKSLFVEQTIDHRIEEALPLLARITQEANAMKEAQIFESWVNNLVEGTWAIPETPEQKQTLVNLMSSELIVGPDATNATEQLYDIFGDDILFDQLQELADADADADARSVIMTRMEELSDQSPDIQAVLGQLQTSNPAEPEAQPDAEELGQEVKASSLNEFALTHGGDSDENMPAIIMNYMQQNYPSVIKQFGEMTVYEVINDRDSMGYYRPEEMKNKDLDDLVMGVIDILEANYGDEQDVEEAQCNMTEAGEYCPKHKLEECGIMEYSGNWTNFGLEESDALAQLKQLAHGK